LVGNRTTSLPTSAARTLESGTTVGLTVDGAVVTIGGGALAAKPDTDGVSDAGAAVARRELGAESGPDAGGALRTVGDADPCGFPVDR
jgi:hypothetical protein